MHAKYFRIDKNSRIKMFSLPQCTSAWHSASVEEDITRVECPGDKTTQNKIKIAESAFAAVFSSKRRIGVCFQ